MGLTSTAEKGQIDYYSPIKAKHMRKICLILGSIWTDIGKLNTDLNMMLSSPLFRHKDDPDAEKILLPKSTLSTTLNEEVCTPRGTPKASEKDDKIEHPIDE